MSDTVETALTLRHILRWKRRSLGGKCFKLSLGLILIDSIGWHNSVIAKLTNKHFFRGTAKELLNSRKKWNVFIQEVLIIKVSNLDTHK